MLPNTMADSILERMGAEKVDLIVMAAQGHTRLGRLVLGTTALERSGGARLRHLAFDVKGTGHQHRTTHPTASRV
jgi:hypothetical protein